MVPGLSAGDAIGNDVLGEYEVLRRKGFDVTTYCEHCDHRFRRIVSGPRCIRKAEIVIYHHGINWPRGEKLLRESNARLKVLRYHNVTPPEFFRGYSPELEKLTRLGREQTPRLVQACTHFLADSAYNAKELTGYGASPDRCRVLPPFNHIEELLSLQADVGLLESLIKSHVACVLSVGRQAPNKGLHHFLRVAHSFKNLFGKRARFIWVGGRDPNLSRYYAEIDRYILTNRLNDVVFFPGRVSASRLKTYYLASKVFLTLSEHEGFCVPVVEAQALGVPVVALARAAVPETAGENQLIFEEIDYERFAAAVAVLLANPDYRLHLASHGKENYQKRFARQVLEAAFLQALEEMCSL
jgi:glycosyltransferase involved in cell wall biosynthesis